MIIYQNVFISWNWLMFIQIVSWRASMCVFKQNSVWFPVTILIYFFFIASVIYSVAGTAQEMLFSLNPCAKTSIGVNNPVHLLPLDGLVKQGRMQIPAAESKIAKRGDSGPSRMEFWRGHRGHCSCKHHQEGSSPSSPHQFKALVSASERLSPAKVQVTGLSLDFTVSAPRRVRKGCDPFLSSKGCHWILLQGNGKSRKQISSWKSSQGTRPLVLLPLPLLLPLCEVSPSRTISPHHLCFWNFFFPCIHS